jgi:hypothetical protein
MPHARAAAGRAVGVAGRRRACGAGTKWERFYYFLFNARDPISAEALQLLANKCFNCVGAPSPPDSWLTREVLYIAPSGFDSSGDRRQQLAAYNASRPMACAHKTMEEWSRSSSARVKTCNHVFGECLQQLATARSSSCTVRVCRTAASEGSEDRHCYLSALHRAGRLHRQVLYRLASA